LSLKIVKKQICYTVVLCALSHFVHFPKLINLDLFGSCTEVFKCDD